MSNLFYLKKEISFLLEGYENQRKLINLPMTVQKGNDLDYKLSFFVRGDIKESARIELNIGLLQRILSRHCF